MSIAVMNLEMSVFVH